jgi:SpoVK/Ycf46/Vps4 family AAA+-type ATPase
VAVVSGVKLHETKHPDRRAVAAYEGLVGIDAQKEDLLQFLLTVLDADRVARWQRKHYPDGLKLADKLQHRSPLAVLAGEVGCGKTALATSIGSAVATTLDSRVMAIETPSDIRGGGLVGELSARVTAAFDEAQTIVGNSYGLLIIDEGDDLATSRSQMQAHHEDRAGLNVLIKEVDNLARRKSKIAVLLITNRLTALDPALVRRAHVIVFDRPDASARRALFTRLLQGIAHTHGDIDELVSISERTPRFSSSDIVHRGMDIAVRAAIQHDRPVSIAGLKAVLETLVPTPLVEP